MLSSESADPDGASRPGSGPARSVTTTCHRWARSRRCLTSVTARQATTDSTAPQAVMPWRWVRALN